LKFLNFPVAAQAVLFIAALGVLSIAANWFCLERLDEIDRLNATVNCHLAPARLALAEAKAASESFGVAVDKDYSVTDPDHTGAGIGDARRGSQWGLPLQMIGVLQVSGGFLLESVSACRGPVSAARIGNPCTLVRWRFTPTKQIRFKLSF